MNREKLEKELTEARSDLSGLLAAAEADGDRSLTAEESKRFDELEATIEARKADLRRVEVAEREADQAAKLAEARNKHGLGDGDPSIRVGSEERTYRRGGQHRFYQDLCAVSLPGGNYAAQERLQRHAKEQAVEARNSRSAVSQIQARAGVDTSDTSAGVFLPPDYLLDEYIALPRPERVLADLVRQQTLPKGPMQISIPKVTTGTAVGAQATENTAVTEQDLAAQYVTANVGTLAGKQVVSLQAIEQSSVPFDDIVFQDLQRALDAQVENVAVAATLAVTGLNSITATYTTGTNTPDVPFAIDVYPFIGQAKSAVFKSIFRSADVIIMTPDRWAWMEVGADKNGRPLVVPSDNGPWNTIGTVTGQMRNGPTPVGKMFGLPVFVDAQLPTNGGDGTNQDDILVLSSQDLILWESAPVARALPQTLGDQLSILLQTYEYYAYMPDRLPGAISDVNGTDLVTPTF